jgi:hypothetical protein
VRAGVLRRYRLMNFLPDRKFRLASRVTAAMRHCELGANDTYDCVICDDFMQVLIRVARPLYVSDPIRPDADNRPVRTGLSDH